MSVEAYSLTCYRKGLPSGMRIICPVPIVRHRPGPNVDVDPDNVEPDPH